MSCEPPGYLYLASLLTNRGELQVRKLLEAILLLAVLLLLLPSRSFPHLKIIRNLLSALRFVVVVVGSI